MSKDTVDNVNELHIESESRAADSRTGRGEGEHLGQNGLSQRDAQSAAKQDPKKLIGELER